jgi:hypothetical protein
VQPVALVWPVLAPILKKIIKKNYFDKEMVEEDFEALTLLGIIKLFADTAQLFSSFFLNCTDIAQNLLVASANSLGWKAYFRGHSNRDHMKILT